MAVAFTRVLGYYGSIVSRAYEQFVGREPDEPGLEYWAARMQAGLSEEQLDAAMIGSPEYVRDHGGSDAAWVDSVYRDLFALSAPAGEEQYWVSQLS